MTTAHLDCSSGISGDKFLGALLDVGTQTGTFTAQNLTKLAKALTPEATIKVATTTTHGITATSITVTPHPCHPERRGEAPEATCEHTTQDPSGKGTLRMTKKEDPTPVTQPPSCHPERRGEAPESNLSEAKAGVSRGSCVPHAHVPLGASHSNDSHHHSRRWRDIRALLQSLPADTLAPTARDKALAVFGSLAQAEARIHGCATDNVHFHEIGAADSIVDIVGVCAGLDALEIKTLYATPPALGSGTVETRHGTLPVPAPATAALLRGMPTSMSRATGELTTPTGAALLGLAAGFGPVPPLTPEAIGYGAGTRDIGQPNICRLLLGQPDAATALTGTTPAAPRPDTTTLLETNIDHITPEAVAFAGEELLAEGALDVWVTPIAMKKGRAALTLSLLATPDRAEHFAARMMKLTGTLGVRVSEQARLIADRESATIQTEWGPVAVKLGSGRIRPEHEEIARIAREHSLDYPQVLKEVTTAARHQLLA